MSKDPIQEALDALRSAGAVATTPSQTHLGVPNDYRPPTIASLYGTQDIPGQRPYSESVMGQAVGKVRYKPGDELRPVQTPEVVLQLQAQLANIGYLNPDSIRPGVWDSTSAAAYKKVLAYANLNGITAQEAMTILGQNPTLGQLQGGTGRAPNIVELSNPLDIAAVAQTVAQKTLGRNVSQADLDRITQIVQGQETGAQNKTYTMGGPKGSGGTVVQPASVGATSEDYYKKNFGDEAYGYAAVEHMNDFFSLLHSPVQGAAQ